MRSDLMRRDIHYLQGIEVEEAVEIMRHCCFNDEEMLTNERIVRSAEESQWYLLMTKVFLPHQAVY